MLYAGLDLSRKRLDYHLLDDEGVCVDVGAAPPDADGLEQLTRTLARHGQPIRAGIESMNGARFVHDQLELHGWEVEIADAVKVKGLAPLACKTDRIDAWVLAELVRRQLLPALWLPAPRLSFCTPRGPRASPPGTSRAPWPPTHGSLSLEAHLKTLANFSLVPRISVRKRSRLGCLSYGPLQSLGICHEGGEE
jgi:hypothetical protein